MRGPGKYDAIASKMRKELAAEGLVVLVVNGTRGSGFSAEGLPEILKVLPKALREIADAMDLDLRSSHYD